MFNVQILNNISPFGLQQFSKELYHVNKDHEQPDAILVRSFKMNSLKFSKSLQVVGRAGVGVNNIPIDRLTELGIPVLNTPGANTNAVRELVLAGMLLASRNICAAADYVRLLEADDDASLEKQVEICKKKFSGSELRGKVLGVIGLGNIGVQVANAAHSLGMQIYGYDPAITVERAWQLSADVRQASQLDELLQKSDFVTLHVPLLPETKNLINADKLTNIKKSLVLLNFSRFGIVDEESLEIALDEKKLSTYVTDFPTQRLKKRNDVICLPHLGASTNEAEENCALMVVNQVKNFLENGNIVNSVNFPAIELPRVKGGVRMAFAHRNMPGMVAQISTHLAEQGINIIGLQNGSRDEIAYTLVDISANIKQDNLDVLTRIQGMMRIRQHMDVF